MAQPQNAGHYGQRNGQAQSGRIMPFPQRVANGQLVQRERVIPQTLEGEQDTLGAMMIGDVEATALALELLSDADFYRPLHKKIFNVIKFLFEKGESVELFNVVEEFRRRPSDSRDHPTQLEEVGGAAYLTALIESCSSSANIERYARNVIEKSGMRQLLTASDELVREVCNGDPGAAFAAAGTVEKWLRQIQHRQNAEPTPSTISAVQLEEMEFPAPTWTVPELLPTGLFIFGGKIKMGKSFLAQSLAFAVAFGGYFLGQIEVEQGEVLYLALEDTFHRLKDRQRKVLRDEAGQNIKPPEDLHYQIAWPRADENGVERIAAWLDVHPRARLVVIDILQKFRPKRKSGGDLYEEDYEALGSLKALADERGITIIVLHHLSKRETDDVVDALLGTVGVGGTADGTWVLERKRSESEAVLHVSGRDVGDEQKALLWNPETFTWSMLGDAEEVREKGTREKILDALRAKGETLSPSQIAEDTDVNINTVIQTLRRMVEDGTVHSPSRGQYRLPLHYLTNADLSAPREPE
jgi:hypothetical protein